jgi:hypothetical protein
MNLEVDEKLLTIAFKLLIETGNDHLSKHCVDIVESISGRMTSKQVSLCKKAALAAIEYEKEYGHAH